MTIRRLNTREHLSKQLGVYNLETRSIWARLRTVRPFILGLFFLTLVASFLFLESKNKYRDLRVAAELGVALVPYVTAVVRPQEPLYSSTAEFNLNMS
jgi:hypothetical protein